MFPKLKSSWTLTKACLQVLRQDKELMLFPLMCGLVTILCTIGFVVPAVSMLDSTTDSDSLDLVFTLMGFAYAFVTYSVVLFFNVAVLSCARKRFQGGDPTLADGFRAGFENIGVILSWAAVGGVVSFVMRQLEESLGLFGSFLARILGGAFSVVSFFAIPVMVFEKAGPVTAFKRSGEIIKKTWGESLGAYLGFSIITTIAAWSIILGIGASIFASVSLDSVTPIAVGGLSSVVMLLVASILTSCLSQIFQAALYVYATTGEIPSGMSNDLLEDAFRVKKGRKWVLDAPRA